MGAGAATASGGGAIARRRPAGRRARALIAAVAFVALGTVLAIDCLNLVGSESWHDLSRTPHLNAVHRPREQAQARRPLLPAAAVPAPLGALVPALAVGTALLVVPPVRSRLAPGFGRTRAPPHALVAGAPS
jgi:hypothetical protein